VFVAVCESDGDESGQLNYLVIVSESQCITLSLGVDVSVCVFVAVCESDGDESGQLNYLVIVSESQCITRPLGVAATDNLVSQSLHCSSLAIIRLFYLNIDYCHVTVMEFTVVI